MLDNKCAFNHIYKFDADHVVGGVSIRKVRKELARQMSNYIRATGISFDFVSAIPNTGYFYAEDVAKHLDCEFARIFEKKTYKRTLGNVRHKRVSIYDSLLMSFDSVDKASHVLFIDEAMLSGLTVQIIADACQEIGIAQYSFAFMSPITMCQCPWDHVKHADLRFEGLNSEPSVSKENKIRRELLEETSAKEILFCPTNIFCEVIDCSMHCSLCFYEYKGS